MGTRTRTRWLRAFAVLTLSSGFAGCGGSEPEPKAPEPEAPPPPEHHAPKLDVSSELGQIDPAETEKAFQRLQPQLMACYQSGQQRIEYLAGDVSFYVRVAQDGSAKWAFFQDSTLGDRDSERCMLDAIKRARWPQPTGGEAEVKKQIGFDAPGNVRAPTSWSSDRVAATLGNHGSEASRCKKGTTGSFHVTAYVHPAGKQGRVEAVGVAPPNQDADAQVDCIVDAVKKMKLPSPGSYAAKVTFLL